MTIREAQQTERDSIETLDEAAKKIQKKSGYTMNYGDAYVKAMKNNPEVYAEYVAARQALTGGFAVLPRER